MSRRGVVHCLLAAVLFGVTAPLTSELAGSVPTFTLAGLLYIGAALAVTPSVVRSPPNRGALAAEWRPVAVAVIAGGAIGPLLLVAGLARTDAATASILLNTELVATVVLAALFFGERIGRRLLTSVVLITVAGVLLTWGPGAAVDVGGVLIIAACVAWGLDNCVTAHIEQLTPEQVVALKGVAAGGVNLVIGLSIGGWGVSTDVAQVLAALAIGAAGYGLSITLWVRGARLLGAARGQLIFASAPFIGAVMAWTVLGDPVDELQVVAVLLAVVGIAMSVRPVHVHEHRHRLLVHSHPHVSGLHHRSSPG